MRAFLFYFLPSSRLSAISGAYSRINMASGPKQEAPYILKLVDVIADWLHKADLIGSIIQLLLITRQREACQESHLLKFVSSQRYILMMTIRERLLNGKGFYVLPLLLQNLTPQDRMFLKSVVSVMKSLGSGVRLPGFKSQLYHFLTV